MAAFRRWNRLPTRVRRTTRLPTSCVAALAPCVEGRRGGCAFSSIFRRSFASGRQVDCAMSNSGGHIPRGVLCTQLSEPFTTLGGDVIENVQVRWEQWGDPSLPASRTIVVMPSFSHPAHVCPNLDDPSPGWWSDMVGAGKFIDTTHWRVLCPAILGAPWGTTSPLCDKPGTTTPYGPDFPQLTPADLARCHHTWLQEIGVTGKIHGAVGISLGGMQVLQYASLFPDSVARISVISSTGFTSPASNALRYIQRHAVTNDADYMDGHYPPGKGPKAGLAVARELGLLTYQSMDEFNERFDWQREQHTGHGPASDIERYLKYLGDKFASSFDANCYVLLSKASDMMVLGNGDIPYSEAVTHIEADSLFISVDTDFLTPPSQLESIHSMLRREGRASSHVVLSTPYGHDTAFKDVREIGPLVRDHFEAGLSEELERERFQTTGLAQP